MFTWQVAAMEVNDIISAQFFYGAAEGTCADEQITLVKALYLYIRAANIYFDN